MQAADYALEYKTTHPVESNNYENIKKRLIKKVHGGETRASYATELENCKRRSGESINNYVWRLGKLFNQVYPTNQHSSPEVLRAHNRFKIDYFIRGLSHPLKNKLQFEKETCLDNLIELAEKYDAIEEGQVKQIDERIEAFNQKNSTSADINKTLMEQFAQTMKEVVQQIRPEPRQVRFNQSDIQQNRPYCSFHKVFGHATNDCYTKSRIENHICRNCNNKGHLEGSCPKQTQSPNQSNTRRQNQEN